LIDARKDIVFRNTDYKPLFKIKDGDSIKITVAYDGEELVRKCRFLDETHMNVGSTCLHMDEFMERQTRVGNKYEPYPTEPKLDILFVEPGQKPRDIEIPINMGALRELVGGQLDIVPLGYNTAIVCGITGSGAFDKSSAFAICGLNGDKLTSLHPYSAQKYKLEYTPQEKSSTVIKPSIHELLDDAKKAVDEMNQTIGRTQPAQAVSKKKPGMDI
jgi:hypothetical protein